MPSKHIIMWTVIGLAVGYYFSNPISRTVPVPRMA